VKVIMEKSDYKNPHRIIHLIPENEEDKKHLDEWDDQYQNSNEYIEVYGPKDEFGLLVAAGGINDDEFDRIKNENQQPGTEKLGSILGYMALGNSLIDKDEPDDSDRDDK